jgi:hypothetical protein
VLAHLAGVMDEVADVDSERCLSKCAH